jgi:nucleotide-binding universal stress UspA family protein
MSRDYKVIVIGVDKSATAKEAFGVAARLAKLAGARLHVVMAMSDVHVGNVRGPGGEEFFIDEGDEARRYLDELLKAEAVTDSSLCAEAGRPADLLVSEARRLDAELIVVGNRRVQSAAGRVLGSVATDVARHAPCDVYIANTTGA